MGWAMLQHYDAMDKEEKNFLQHAHASEGYPSVQLMYMSLKAEKGKAAALAELAPYYDPV